MNQAKTASRINLHKNQLSSFPFYPRSFSDITVLDLGNNNFSEIPSTITDLQSLEALDMRRNRITFIPYRIGKLSKLKILLLCENKIQGVTPEIGKMDALRLLDLTANPVIFPSQFLINLMSHTRGTQVTTLEINIERTRRVKSTLTMISDHEISSTDSK